MNDINVGTEFDFTYAPGTSTDQIVAFETAGEIWSSYLQDNVTIRIHVEPASNLPEEVIGAALPARKKDIKYEKIFEEMYYDANSSDDRLAYINLPSDDKRFEVLVEGFELDKTKKLKLTNANAKSLNLLSDNDQKLDGYIIFNDLTGDSTVGWDYDALRSGNIASNQIDLVSVAMHEIGHILGFVSGIDDDGWLEVLAESREKAREDDDEDSFEDELEDKDLKFVTPLDLFRYSSQSAAEGKIDFSTGGDPFFSIDGGKTRLGNFANGEFGEFGGDGYQGSHWQQNSNQGIMNPVLMPGRRKELSNLDLKAMDVIGWNVDSNSFVNWQEAYDKAVQNSQTAIVRDRTKDLEKLVKESELDVRRGRRSSTANYFWQLGLWQVTTLDELDEIDLEEIEDNSSVIPNTTDFNTQDNFNQNTYNSSPDNNSSVIPDTTNSNTQDNLDRQSNYSQNTYNSSPDNNSSVIPDTANSNTQDNFNQNTYNSSLENNSSIIPDTTNSNTQDNLDRQDNDRDTLQSDGWITGFVADYVKNNEDLLSGGFSGYRYDENLNTIYIW